MAVLGRERLARSLLAAVLPPFLGLCALPAPARAGWQEFVPIPFENSLTLDLVSTYESYETDRGEQRHTESDNFAREKLTFVSNGFSYHPRFIQYHLLLATALKQETSRNDSLDTATTNGSGFDYDLRLNVLPEHPYRLNLFTSRTEPLYKQYFAADAGAVTTRSGAVFNYRGKPYFLNLRYVETSRTWTEGSSDQEVYGATGTYFKDFGGGRIFSLSPYYEHSASRPSSSPSGSAENYGVSNTIDVNTSSLQSSVARNIYRQDQDAGTRGQDGDGFTWLERLHLQLPANLKTLFTYRYQTHEQTIAPYGTSGGEVRSVNNQDYELDIIHMLYRSLETTYRFRRNIADSSDGYTATTSNSLAANYSKIVPNGILLAGAYLGRSETDGVGRTTVANEAHEHIGLNEVFTEQQRDADCGSIRVFLTDHAAGDRPIAVDFVAVPSPGARCDIMVTGIPADFDETVPHDYTVSYTIEAGDYTLRTDSYGYNASLNLFNNNVNPYFSRSVTSAKQVSGSYLGTPFDGSVSTVGLVLGNLPLRLLGEYQESDASVYSYRKWRGEAEYRKSVTTTTSVTLITSYTRTEYPEGSTAASPQAYTDEETRISASIQQRLFRRRLTLSAGGSYASFAGLMDSSSYSYHASLQWRIGQTTITAGANGYYSLSDHSPEPDSEQSREYYYLNLRRDIF
jgi:hypothetical protein